MGGRRIMANFHEGYKDIKVRLLSWEGDNIAKRVYEFGRLSNDFNYELTKEYSEEHNDCIKLIDKIINGTTLPKFALMGTRMEFEICGISRICLAQLTRDNAIFASQGGGVFPLTMDYNIPLSLYNIPEVMDRVKKAQELIEEAYIIACEKEVPALEARYIGLHAQTISLTASYTFSDFVRSCHSRTSSNFCDECNLVYRLMYRAIIDAINDCKDKNSIKIYNWIFAEDKCINDKTYKRERLYNSDFTWDKNYEPELPAINDWRKSCWKLELERMYADCTGYLTDKEIRYIEEWLYSESMGHYLPTSYDDTQPDVAKNMIKNTPYYKEVNYD
jgi:hypothetical protein